MPFDTLNLIDLSGEPHDRLNVELSKNETEVLGKITEADKEKLRVWHKTRLLKDGAHIVGVRSEDLLYFLQCVHQGYISVGASPFKAKGDSERYFFVTPNPENEDIKKHPDLLHDDRTLTTFHQAIRENTTTYSKIAQIQAIYQSIIIPYVGQEDFIKIVCKFHQIQIEDIEGSPLVEIEGYFSTLVQELRDLQKDSLISKNHKPALFFLWQYLKGKGIKLPSLINLLINIQNRGSICLAFNSNLIKNYKGSTDDKIIHTTDEFLVDVPNGRLSLDTVYGFESLGDFEDDILKRLGV